MAFEQNGQTFYQTVLTKNDFPKHTITDPYTLQNTEGYQRLLDPKRVEDYRAHVEENTSLRPILLNVRKPKRIQQHGKGRFVKITVPDKLWIVDGQHFHGAIQLRKSKALFEVPIIFCNVEAHEETSMFEVINVTARHPKTALIQQIAANQKDKRLVDSLSPSLARTTEIIAPATRVTNALSGDSDSLWFGRIELYQMKPDKVRRPVTQAGFVNSLSKNLFSANANVTEKEAQAAVNALWDGAKRAWSTCFNAPESEAYNLVGMMGVGILHRVLGRFIFPRLRGTKFVADEQAYKDILVASGYTTRDWLKGVGRIGIQLATKNVVYETIMKDMVVGMTKNWPQHLPQLPTKKKSTVKTKKIKTIDLRANKATAGR
jgi:DGQHR domain-containing protein